MQTEIEAKFLDVEPDQLRKQLVHYRAKLINPERLMKRKTFDFKDRRLQRLKGWIRVRDEGDKVTLSYKQLNNRSIQGTKEVSAVVADFNDTCNFLYSIGIEQKSYQETKRESWVLDDVEIEIDHWPWIPPCVELEGKSEESVSSLLSITTTRPPSSSFATTQ